MKPADRFPLSLLVTFLVVLVWSVVSPKEYFTWVLEVFPAIVGIIILLATYRKFRFSNVAYGLMFIFACILAVGGHYTYAEVPLGFWMEAWFGWTRNNYDKIGHFVQGVIPAVLTRELLLRTSPLKRGGWLFTLSTCVALAISAAYELFEWLGAVAFGSGADAFLGTQGYVWDTQTDMGLALVGAVLALLLLTKQQDISIEKISKN